LSALGIKISAVICLTDQRRRLAGRTGPGRILGSIFILLDYAVYIYLFSI